MLSTRQQALRKQRKGGPENGTENRPEIGPAGQFHRQCVEPLRCPDCGVYRRAFFLPSEKQETLPLARQSMLSSIRPVLKHHADAQLFSNSAKNVLSSLNDSCVSARSSFCITIATPKSPIYFVLASIVEVSAATSFFFAFINPS